MAILTNFGKFIRKMRIDKDVSLKEMADHMKITPAFLSGMETGRKAISPTMLNKITLALNLTLEESAYLNKVALEQINELRIPMANNSNAERLLAYARRLDGGEIDVDLTEIFEE